ncbi:hypothetical protein [Rhizocola hellebori]|uniref:hypothetical protein n=1 Tax=Rhizocola hellebori TaxID=1392758 RepID=UPI001EF182B1|nr:hypothetical protein [Rhizocola hellebori]
MSERVFSLDDHPLFIAEGIFAAEVVQECARRGLLADAFALRRPRTVTFTRRLVRDLAEHRKPPKILFRRGLLLWRNDPEILRRQSELGCRPMTARAIWRRVRMLISKPISRKPA